MGKLSGDFDTLPTGGKRPMGLGLIGTGGIVFKRKFRWTMQIEYCLDVNGADTADTRFVPEEFVKVGARPQLDIEETEINYLHGKMWIPGKATWQTMTVTYYDVTGNASDIAFTTGGSDGAGADKNITGLFGWLASVYDITDNVNLYMGAKASNYQGQGLILLYDGCGFPLEGWLLKNMWPQSINFGELDMSSSEECTVELTLRYSNVQYKNYCFGSIEKCPCTSCDVAG